MSNLEAGSKSLSENMEAAKSNILLRGFFKKKQREKERLEKERLAKEKKEKEEAAKKGTPKKQ